MSSSSGGSPNSSPGDPGTRAGSHTPCDPPPAGQRRPRSDPRGGPGADRAGRDRDRERAEPDPEGANGGSDGADARSERAATTPDRRGSRGTVGPKAAATGLVRGAPGRDGADGVRAGRARDRADSAGADRVRAARAGGDRGRTRRDRAGRDGAGRDRAGRDRGRGHAGAGRTDRDGPPEYGSPGARFRLLLASALGSVLLSYVLSVLVAALAGLTAGAAPVPGALLEAAIPLWLAGHQVPLLVDGAPLGVLPLLPTVGLIALAAAWAMRVTRRLGGRVREDAPAAVATLAGTHASVAVLATALPANPAPATPWAALLGGGLVTATGAGLGALRVTGPPAWWAGAPRWLPTGLAAAGVGAAALASAGGLMLFAALLADVGDVHAWLAAAAPGVGAGLGITLLSICYVPNAMIASIGWLAGPGLSVGAAAASPLYASPGALPPVPLMAAFPMTAPPSWTVVAFVLPMVAGALLGQHCRKADQEPKCGLRSVAVAVLLVGVGCGLLAAVVGGRLGAGPFDPIRIPPVAIGAALLGWLGVPAVVVALLPRRALSRGPSQDTRRRRPPGPSPRAGRAADPARSAPDGP